MFHYAMTAARVNAARKAPVRVIAGPVRSVKTSVAAFPRLRQQQIPHAYHTIRPVSNPSPPVPHAPVRFQSTEVEASIGRIRNLGIIAHIDAGKTTATERFLFFAGKTNRCGEVHTGDTITDYLPQERERGITIKAAALSFSWRQHTFNLIDTPGHVDFTIEVERSMRVLDGAVALYDAVSGVEAQSETVWNQATRYAVPRIGFVNKMDREGASLSATVASIEKRLSGLPLVLQMPLGEGGNFAGSVDLLDGSVYAYTDKEGRTLVGKNLVNLSADPRSKLELMTAAATLERFEVGELVSEFRRARAALVEKLADLDETIADAYLLTMDDAVDEKDAIAFSQGLDSDDLRQAVKRALRKLPSKVIPVLCGSAYKNKGIQPLLDAVIDYLPSPLERPPIMATDKHGKPVAVRPFPTEPMRALAFKVQNHPQRGPLVFFRVFSGVVSEKLPLLNVNRDVKERPGKLLQIFADSQREVEAVSAGHIAAATGLKSVKTGDTLCFGNDPDPVVLPGVSFPQPVFTAALEVPGQSEQKALEAALLVLTREDPSLHAGTNADTGQLLLSGMGELHLDIAADRLRREYDIPVTLGRMMVSYRETVSSSATVQPDGRMQYTYDRMLANKRHFAKLSISIERIEPVDGVSDGHTQDLLRNEYVEPEQPLQCKVQDDETGQLKPLSPALTEALKDGIMASFGRGPLLGYALAGIRVRVNGEECEVGPDTTPAAMRACVAKCMELGLAQGEAQLLEPMMTLEVTVPEQYVGDIVNDITSHRRGRIKEITSPSTYLNDEASSRGGKIVVRADVPLKTLVGYSTAIRSRTAGEGNFSMEFAYYEHVGPLVQRQLIEDPLSA